MKVNSIIYQKKWNLLQSVKGRGEIVDRRIQEWNGTPEEHDAVVSNFLASEIGK